MSAIIDIGSNSVRFLMNGQKGINTTRLGAMERGYLTDSAMENTLEAIAAFADRARAAGHEPRAFATNAVRDATNGGDFLRMVRERCGVDAELLSGEAEAALAFEGASPHRPGMHCVMDQGGGSAEVTTGRERPENTISLPLGAVRLTRMFPCGDPPNADAVSALHRHALDAYSRERGRFPDRVDTFTLTGGTATSLAALDRAMETYDPALVQDHVLTAATLSSWLERLTSMTHAERLALPGMHPARADIIIAGTASICAFMEAFGAHEARVSDRDIIDAYAERPE